MLAGANHPQTAWTQAIRDQIAAMLRENLSASEIGGRIGRSRNAVIGVVSRDPTLREIGLRGKSGTKTVAVTAKRRHRTVRGGSASRAKITAASIPFEPAPVITGAPQMAGRPLMAMGSGQCRFPVNDAARGEQHLFCGAPSDGSWCEGHRAIVYQPRPAR